jgi:hypothetical protein
MPIPNVSDTEIVELLAQITRSQNMFWDKREFIGNELFRIEPGKAAEMAFDYADSAIFFVLKAWDESTSGGSPYNLISAKESIKCACHFDELFSPHHKPPYREALDKLEAIMKKTEVDYANVTVAQPI